MIKVGLYLENRHIADVDLSKPYLGNPGVGGTEYNFINMPYNFMEFRPDEVEFVFFANSIKLLPEQFTSCQVDDCLSAIDKSVQTGCDIFIWRPVLSDDTFDVLKKLDEVDIRAVAWVHNTPSNEIMHAMASTKNLKKFITVSHEQLDVLRDLSIIYKSHVICNGFDLNSVPSHSLGPKDKNMVVYIGSLIPAKGFGVLAKAWPDVLKQHPSAELYVIGSGQLYNRNAVLGKWGVADESFEASEIRPYLSDKNGDPISSVKFLGTLGEGKVSYLAAACVGVVNPSAKTENCPGSAIEFQAAKTPVVSVAQNGLLDTVLDKETGLLGSNVDDLADNIVYFLKNPDKSYEYGENGRNFIAEKFDFEKISTEWSELFGLILGGQGRNLIPMKNNYFYKKKWARDLIRVARSYIYANEYQIEDTGLIPDDSDLMFINQLSNYIDLIKKDKYKMLSDSVGYELHSEIENNQMARIKELNKELIEKNLIINTLNEQLNASLITKLKKLLKVIFTPG